MGLTELMINSKVCIDTSPFIYFIEENPIYLNLVKPVFAEIDAGNIEAITSTITLLEVLVYPLRNDNQELAEKYREILIYSEGLTTFGISNEISETASKLRADYSIKAPDALQIATGIFYKADKFLTNDADLKKISEIGIIVIDDFIC